MLLDHSGLQGNGATTALRGQITQQLGTRLLGLDLPRHRGHQLGRDIIAATDLVLPTVEQ